MCIRDRPQGELKSALQYLSQSMRIKDPEIKDLFLAVAAEELCHLEMVSATVNMLNGDNLDAANATVGNIEAHVLSGLTPMLTNASGYLWTAAYVNETGDAAADILSDIAAEQRAKVVYQYPVSYTHLDVYKRQVLTSTGNLSRFLKAHAHLGSTSSGRFKLTGRSSSASKP